MEHDTSTPDFHRLRAIVSKYEERMLAGIPFPADEYRAVWEEMRAEVAAVGGPLAADLVASIDTIIGQRPILH